MALLTLGSNANNSITNAIKFLPGVGSGMSAADVAAMNIAIKDDQNPLAPIAGGGFTSGMLWIPNRGHLKMLPGDYVGIDSTGWPILLSARAIASGPWTHS